MSINKEKKFLKALHSYEKIGNSVCCTVYYTDKFTPIPSELLYGTSNPYAQFVDKAPRFWYGNYLTCFIDKELYDIVKIPGKDSFYFRHKGTSERAVFTGTIHKTPQNVFDI